MNKIAPKSLLKWNAALADINRLRLIALCRQHALTVTDFTSILSLSQPLISRHLKILLQHGLVSRQKEGNWVWYISTANEPQKTFLDHIFQLLDQEEDTFKSDHKRLEILIENRKKQLYDYFESSAHEWDEIRHLHVEEEVVEEDLRLSVWELRPKTLLDIGTGTGKILQLLSHYVEHGVGIDYSPEMIKIARTQLELHKIKNCEVKLANWEYLPFEDYSFKAITLYQILHFCTDPMVLLKEVTRVLATNGHIFIVDFAKHDHEEFRENYAHHRLGFEDKELQEWFQELNLYPLATRTFPSKQLTIKIWRALKR